MKGSCTIMDNGESQQKLMELVVDKVLKKHGVIDQKPQLDQSDKERIAEIVQNIKADVETFLENANKTKTENDFPQNNVNVAGDEVVEHVIKKAPIYSSNNDVKAVKTFFNRPKK
jgi:spore coat protein W